MKIRYNGWAPTVEEIDLRISTQEEINQIAKLIADNSLVVIKGQNLSVEDEVAIAKKFKNPKPLFKKDTLDFKHCSVEDSEDLIYRVSGGKDKHGQPGIGGYPDEMVWHCDHAWAAPEQEHILIWLYAVKGSKGSCTTWNNNLLSYEQMEQPIKDWLAPLQATYIKNREHKYNDLDEGVPTEYTLPIIRKNITGKHGIFFPIYQVDSIEGVSREDERRIMIMLTEYTTQERFLYHHYWEDGDIVISDQWYSMHKRWAFDRIEERLCHRIWFGYPDQDYKR
jgi:taurine dioxygenase